MSSEVQELTALVEKQQRIISEQQETMKQQQKTIDKQQKQIELLGNQVKENCKKRMDSLEKKLNIFEKTLENTRMRILHQDQYLLTSNLKQQRMKKSRLLKDIREKQPTSGTRGQGKQTGLRNLSFPAVLTAKEKSREKRE